MYLIIPNHSSKKSVENQQQFSLPKLPPEKRSHSNQVRDPPKIKEVPKALAAHRNHSKFQDTLNVSCRYTNTAFRISLHYLADYIMHQLSVTCFYTALDDMQLTLFRKPVEVNIFLLEIRIIDPSSQSSKLIRRTRYKLISFNFLYREQFFDTLSCVFYPVCF